jgi:hypothetical protein
LVYLSVFLFPNLYIILFWEFCFLAFSVHAQTNVILCCVHRFLFIAVTENAPNYIIKLHNYVIQCSHRKCTTWRYKITWLLFPNCWVRASWKTWSIIECSGDGVFIR